MSPSLFFASRPVFGCWFAWFWPGRAPRSCLHAVFAGAAHPSRLPCLRTAPLSGGSVLGAGWCGAAVVRAQGCELLAAASTSEARRRISWTVSRPASASASLGLLVPLHLSARTARDTLALWCCGAVRPVLMQSGSCCKTPPQELGGFSSWRYDRSIELQLEFERLKLKKNR